MNVKLSYLYRDASNYKQHHAVIFANPNQIEFGLIQETISNNLIDGGWFIAKEWDLPDLHFREYEWDEEIDHQWHEFEKIEETNKPATMLLSISELLEKIRATKN